MKNVTGKGPAIKIGVSGKRHILPGEVPRIRREIREEIRRMLKEHHCVEFTGYSALATGADTIFAEVVRKEFEQPLHIILPFALEAYEKDFQGGDLDVFRGFVRETGDYEIAEPLIPMDAHARDAAYFEAGKKIVDACDETVIVWDGLRPRGIGGTAEVLGYLAEKKGKEQIPLIKIKPARKDELHEDLVHKFEKANKLGIMARNSYKRVWKWAIFLGWMTAAFFACKMAFTLEGRVGLIISLFEFLFVVTVYILIFLAKKRNYHGHYLQERMSAETYRLLRCFYHAGVKVDISERSRQEGNMFAEIAEKINRSQRSAGVKSKWYTQYVIKSLIREQVAYHDGKVKSIGNNHDVFERVNLFIAAFFIVNLAVHLIHLLTAGDEGSGNWLYRFGTFFNILLPGSYAALEGVIYFSEWASLKKYSDAARLSLKEAEDLLPEHLEQTAYEACHKGQVKALHLISSTMLTDNRNWNLLLEYKNNYHLIV